MGISVNPRTQHAWAWNVCYKIFCPSSNNKNDVLLILSENFITWPNLTRIFCFQRAYLSSITKQLKKEQPDSGAGTRQKSAAKGEPTSLYQRCQIFPLPVTTCHITYKPVPRRWCYDITSTKYGGVKFIPPLQPKKCRNVESLWLWLSFNT